MGTTTGVRRLQTRMLYVIAAVVVMMAIGAWAVGVSQDEDGLPAAQEDAPTSEASNSSYAAPLGEAEDLFEALEDAQTGDPSAEDTLGAQPPAAVSDLASDLAEDMFADPTFAGTSVPDATIPDTFFSGSDSPAPTSAPPANDDKDGRNGDKGGDKKSPKPEPDQPADEDPSDDPSGPEDEAPLDPLLDPLLDPITNGPLG